MTERWSRLLLILSSILLAAPLASRGEPLMGLAHGMPGARRTTAAGEPQVEILSGGLEGLFEPGPIFQDRNDDDVIDFVDAALVLGPEPEPGDVAAAADVAARLGFETMAMNIPLSASPSGAGTAIVVGARALARVGLGTSEAGLADLAAGQGRISVLSSGERLRVVIAGADDVGTRVAAETFAGRLPHVWEPGEATLADVVAAVTSFLAEQGVTVRAAAVPAVEVRAGIEALETLVVEVSLASAAELDQGRRALRDLADRRPSAGGEEAPLSFAGARNVRVVLAAAGQRAEVDVPQVAAAPQAGPVPGRPGAGAKDELDLSSLYSIEGLLGDSNQDLIPDRVDALLTPGGPGSERSVDVAARLGLESAGIVVPAAKAPEAIADPAREPTLVIIGSAHPLIDRLVEEGKLERPALAPGHGSIRVVPEAFGSKGVVVVTGGDAAGLSRAIEQMAERFPNVWDRGKDRATIGSIEDDMWRFLSARSPAGQAATALYRLRHLASMLSDRQIESARVIVHADKVEEGLAELVRREAMALIDADSIEVELDDLDVQNAGTIFEEDFEIPSEVEEFWEVFRSEVLPGVQPGRPVDLEVRLSESPDIRRSIAARAREELIDRGADGADTQVTVLSAYKQGFSWLYDVVRPQLEGMPVDRLTIRVAETGPPEEWRHQAMYTPIRWLMEIFPIDEVLANETALTLDQIVLEQTPIGSPTYEVIATAADGSEILRRTFEPKYVLRTYFDVFPEYERARVTTGWIRATVGAEQLVDRRIATDYERFWDHFQSETLRRVYDYVMEVSEGKPSAADAPHFGELRVDLTLSEPHYLLGIDREQISPMESLHEEIYFGVLHFFDVVGRFTRGQALDYPGRVIPVMRPKNDGLPGRARISFTGFEAPRPSVEIEYRERDGHEDDERLDLVRFDLEPVRALAALVRDGQPGLERLDLRVEVDTETDERDELIRTWSPDDVDESIMSAEQIAALVANLGRLREAGLYRDELAYQGVGELAVAAGWEHEVDPASQTVATLAPNGTPPPHADIRDRLPDGWRYTGESLVQWETPIPPDEAYDVLARMSTFEEATVYKLATSYLGKEIWAMDLMPPLQASHWAHAKATTFKPTVIYSGREHANEVSSTSHILKLAELLLTDDAYREKLKKVNVVIHPVTNPDGAQLAYDLYDITPDFMLHAGYLGALGVGVQSGYFDPDPIYPESRTRPGLWRTWLPDTYFSPHGYPHHEWVQVFSEYAAWVRNRVAGGRAWWGMRGWYTSVRYFDDPEFPRHRDAAFRARRMIIDYINEAPDVRALNQRAYERYRRWGVAFDPENFRLDVEDGVNAYRPIKGARAGGGEGFTSNPRITVYGSGTEAPDETAYGDWMELVATAGLQFDKANLDYLVQGNHRVERQGSSFFGGVRLSFYRPRPPEDEDAEQR